MTDLEINTLQRRMDSFNDVQKEIKDDIKEIKESVSNLPNTFVTRREYEATQNANKNSNGTRQMVISIVMCVATLAIAIYKL